jgi:hypothetical protein
LTIEITSSCGKRLQTSAEYCGGQGQCPACGNLLQIPKFEDTLSREPAYASSEAQDLFVELGLPFAEDLHATKGTVTPSAKAAAELLDAQPEGPDVADKGKLTVCGCLLTLFSFLIILAVALPIVRWRDPTSGLPLPRMVAIVAPLLIGATIHGIGTLLLRFLGLPVWSKQETGPEK